MLLYHGSNEIVENPIIKLSEKYLDFGNGFYTTSSYVQAQRWSQIKIKRTNSSIGYVNVYEFDLQQAINTIKLKKFENADSQWLNFVVDNRSGKTPNEINDMYVGPVADDNVYQSVRLFETGVLDCEETTKRLKTEILHDQWVFASDRALSFCKFKEYVVIKEHNSNE